MHCGRATEGSSESGYEGRMKKELEQEHTPSWGEDGAGLGNQTQHHSSALLAYSYQGSRGGLGGVNSVVIILYHLRGSLARIESDTDSVCACGQDVALSQYQNVVSWQKTVGSIRTIIAA